MSSYSHVKLPTPHMSRYSHVKISTRQATHISSYPRVQIPTCPATHMSSYPHVQLPTCPATHMSSYPRVKIPTCPLVTHATLLPPSPNHRHIQAHILMIKRVTRIWPPKYVLSSSSLSLTESRREVVKNKYQNKLLLFFNREETMNL